MTFITTIYIYWKNLVTQKTTAETMPIQPWAGIPGVPTAATIREDWVRHRV